MIKASFRPGCPRIATDIKAVEGYNKDYLFAEPGNALNKDRHFIWYRLRSHWSNGQLKPQSGWITVAELNALDMTYEQPPELLIITNMHQVRDWRYKAHHLRKKLWTAWPHLKMPKLRVQEWRKRKS